MRYSVYIKYFAHNNKYMDYRPSEEKYEFWKVVLELYSWTSI